MNIDIFMNSAAQMDITQATVEYHNRIYQRYAISNDLYHAPIDEVHGLKFWC